MAEYIERRALMEDARHDKAIRANLAGIADIANLINDQPAADVVEVRHGEWIKKEDEYYVCSECGRTRPYNRYTYSIDNWVCNYCRWCGAKMDGKGENDG
jgi:hypothetical protein